MQELWWCFSIVAIRPGGASNTFGMQAAKSREEALGIVVLQGRSTYPDGDGWQVKVDVQNEAFVKA